MTECADDTFIQRTEDECWLWKIAERLRVTKFLGKVMAGEIHWRWMQDKKSTHEVLEFWADRHHSLTKMLGVAKAVKYKRCSLRMLTLVLKMLPLLSVVVKKASSITGKVPKISWKCHVAAA